MECLHCHSRFESSFILSVHLKSCGRNNVVDERERHLRSLHDPVLAEQIRYENECRARRDEQQRDRLVTALILDDIICCKECFEKKVK